MKLQKLEKNMVNDFKEFCRKNRENLDDYLISEKELLEFDIDNNITYIITDDNDSIAAAASLKLEKTFCSIDDARFRIFYSEIDDKEYYRILLNKILEDIEGLKLLYIFIPIANTQKIKNLEALKFINDGYELILARPVNQKFDFNLPEDYYIRTYQKGDEKIWCELRNIGFASKPNEHAITPEDVAETMIEDYSIEDGAFILYHKDEPVGLIRGTLDELDGKEIMDIGSIVVRPEYRSRGLARCMLRYAMNFAIDKGFDTVLLCVDTDNANAKTLYLSEGFMPVSEVVCYIYNLTGEKHK